MPSLTHTSLYYTSHAAIKAYNPHSAYASNACQHKLLLDTKRASIPIGAPLVFARTQALFARKNKRKEKKEKELMRSIF